MAALKVKFTESKKGTHKIAILKSNNDDNSCFHFAYKLESHPQHQGPVCRVSRGLHNLVGFGLRRLVLVLHRRRLVVRRLQLVVRRLHRVNHFTTCKIVWPRLSLHTTCLHTVRLTAPSTSVSADNCVRPFRKAPVGHFNLRSWLGRAWFLIQTAVSPFLMVLPLLSFNGEKKPLLRAIMTLLWVVVLLTKVSRRDSGQFSKWLPNLCNQ